MKKKLIVTTKWAATLCALQSPKKKFRAVWGSGRYSIHIQRDSAAIFMGWYIFDYDIQRYEFVFSSSAQNYGFNNTELLDLIAICEKCKRSLPKLTTVKTDL